MKYKFKLLLIISLIALTGCSFLPKPYRMDIEQGNIVKQDVINALAPGMHKQEVVSLLGTPMLVQQFNSNQSDYIYYLKVDGKLKTHYHMCLHFKDDTLTRISGDFKPGQTTN